MNRFELITAYPFSVKFFRSGRDISDAEGVKQVQYFKNGTDVRILDDESRIKGSWRFVDAEQTLVETTAPTGTKLFLVLELTEDRYRKFDLHSSIEIRHFPIR